MNEPVIILIANVTLFSLVPFLLSSLNNQSRTLYFYCYISILFFLGGTLSTIYSIKVSESLVVPGGSLAYCAFMMTTILFVMLQRDLKTIKNVIKIVCGINLFIYFLFALISKNIQASHYSGVDLAVAKLFNQSMPIMLIGMLLILLELILFLYTIEKIKRFVKNTLGIAITYVIVYIFLIVIDGFVFQTLISLVYEVPLQNLENQITIKLFLAILFSSAMFVFLFLNRKRLGYYLSETLDFSDLLPISKSKLLKEINKYREVAELSNKGVRELAERLSIATESFNLGVWELNVDSGKCIWNDKMHELYNTSPRHFSHTISEWKSFILAEDLNKIDEVYSRACKNKEAGKVCYRIKPLGKEPQWIESHFKVFFEEDKPVKLIGLNLDVTNQRRLESLDTELKLQEFNTKKSDALKMLLGGIAHDFGNILLPLSGYAYEVLDSKNTSPTDRSNIRKIIDAASRAEELLSRIIDLLSHQANERRPVKVQDIVRARCKKNASTFPGHINVELDLDENCPSVIVPPIHLSEILNQLFKNALHAVRSSGGNITVRVGSAGTGDIDPYIEAVDSINFIEMVVIDDGEGIESENLDKIFDPYFTTGSRKDGTGLGLAIVKNLVQSSYGKILVYSEKGKGTAVHIKLPAYKLESK